MPSRGVGLLTNLGACGPSAKAGATTAVVHPDLPPTPAWTYDGMLPGPVVVVRSGERINVTHEHNIAGTLAYRHVVVDDDAGGTMNDAGCELPSTDPADLEESAHAAALHAYTVAHLHGAPSGPDSDGWAENVIGLGEERHVEYEFPRESWPMTDHDGTKSSAYRSGAAPMYWYHDHGMSVTRLNVYAGLAGAWLVRDPIEAHLGLPVDEEREIPLVLADRNFDTGDGTAAGPLTGDFLHKVQRGVREAFAPVNLVNGLAWPRCRVSRKVHRLRILNGSNARTYRLHFHAQTAQDDSPGSPLPASAVQQIGTDGGAFTGADGDPDPDGFLVTPQVMRFDLTCSGRHPGLGGRPPPLRSGRPTRWGGEITRPRHGNVAHPVDTFHGDERSGCAVQMSDPKVEDLPVLADHGSAVVVPVGVLPLQRAVQVDQILGGHVVRVGADRAELGVGLRDGVRPPVVPVHQQAGPRIALQVVRLGAIGGD